VSPIDSDDRPKITEAEAEKLCAKIGAAFELQRRLLLQLREANAYRVLRWRSGPNKGQTYHSWGSCAEDRFGIGAQYVKELISAAAVERDIHEGLPEAERETLPTSHLNQMRPLSTDGRREAYTAYKELPPEARNTRTVKSIVDVLIAPSPEEEMNRYSSGEERARAMAQTVVKKNRQQKDRRFAATWKRDAKRLAKRAPRFEKLTNLLEQAGAEMLSILAEQQPDQEGEKERANLNRQKRTEAQYRRRQAVWDQDAAQQRRILRTILQETDDVARQKELFKNRTGRDRTVFSKRRAEILSGQFPADEGQGGAGTEAKAGKLGSGD
jgi:hypothetical protein